MTSIPIEGGRPRRRPKTFLQFGLRSLLILTLLSAFALGWLHRFIGEYRRQTTAAAKLADAGASLQWRPAKPQWLTTLLRPFVEDDLLRDCIAVDAERVGLHDQDIVPLHAMPHVEGLYLAGNPITDQAMPSVASLERLKSLSLWRTGVTDQGLRHLNRLRSLEVLDIHDPQVSTMWGSVDAHSPLSPTFGRVSETNGITSRCLDSFADLRALRRIYFSFSVDDRGVEVLADLPNLRLTSVLLDGVNASAIARLQPSAGLKKLVIQNARLDADSLRHLGRLPNLRLLWLNNVQVPAGAWQGLAELKRLEGLSLRFTSVSDEDLRSLKGLTAMLWLDLCDTSLTADCLEHLSEMKQLRSLYFEAPLDDDGLAVLATLTKLRHLGGGTSGSNAEMTCYVTDAGLAALAKINCLNVVRIHDAYDGLAVAGIDAPVDTDRITDAGLTQLWQRRSYGMATISAQDVTLTGVARNPSQLEGRVIVSSLRPLSEIIPPSLAGLMVAAELNVTAVELGLSDQEEVYNITVRHDREEESSSLLRQMPNIRRLKIGRGTAGAMAESKWENLQYVPHLEVFELEDWQTARSPLDGAAVRWIGQMKALQRLKASLSEQVSPEELLPLGQLKQLEYLTLTCGNVSAGHFQFIGRLEELRKLYLTVRFDWGDDEQVMQPLSNLHQLDEIYLAGISDASMPYLSDLRQLTRVSINGRRVTSAGLRHLENLPRLKYLDVRDTAVTDEQLDAFRQRHPTIMVRTDR